MTCIVGFNSSLLLVNKQSVNSSNNKCFNTRSSCLRLSKNKNLGRKLPVVKAIWKWFETTEDKNGKDTSIEELRKFKSVANFARVRQNETGGHDLQTAIVRYRSQFPWWILQPGVQVDLVANIHIADKEYFADLQQELANYDRVLYEMVTKKDPKQSNRNPRTRFIPEDSLGTYRRFDIIGFFQRSTASILGLHFQGDCLDYRRDNWYHADLDEDTFKLMQHERGENLLSFEIKTSDVSSEVITQSILERETTDVSSEVITQSILERETTDVSSEEREDLDGWKEMLLSLSCVVPMPLVGKFLIKSICEFSSSPIGRSPEMKALFCLDLATAMKLLLSKELASESMAIEEKADSVKNSVIVGERNKVVMEELRATMNDGCQKIAILFGSGHMPDMDERLQTEFHLVPTQIFWKTAWSIKIQKASDQKQLPPFLNGIVKIIGWQPNRYQILALLLFSLILAAELLLWEVVLSSIKDGLDETFSIVAQFLAGLWGKF